MKSIPTINPAITENIQIIQSLKHASFIDFKVGVSLGHGFVLLLVVRIYWTTFQAKKNV